MPNRRRLPAPARAVSFFAMFFVVAAAAAAVAPARADVKFTVDAGDVARRNVPIVATLEGVKDAPPSGPAHLSSGAADAPPVLAQVGRPGEGRITVRWIEPNIAAGQSKTYTLAGAPSAADPQRRFRFAEGDGFRDLYHGDQPVFSQIIKYDPDDHVGSFKPFDHVYTFAATTQPATQPHGQLDRMHQFITKGVGGQYTHHRGIYFGFNKTGYGDFWHCNRGETQRHRSFDPSREWAGPIAAKMSSLIEWVPGPATRPSTTAPSAGSSGPRAGAASGGAGGAVFRETREVVAWRLASHAAAAETKELVLDYEITLETLTGKPEPLGGDAHHAGFHFRANNLLADTSDRGRRRGGASYLFPETSKPVGNDVRGDTPWVNATFDLFDRRYSVTHLNFPDNPQPTTYSTRGYGRFGAFFATEVTPDKPLKVKYRLVIRDITPSAGDPTTQPAISDVESDYRNFIQPVTAKLAE